MAQSRGYRERNSTADRALNILQMYTDTRPEISAVDVAETLGVARSTAYRYLETLVQSGFLTETGRGGFRLGVRILQLARIARTGYGLADLCTPAMHELADRFHQTVLLTKRMGNAVVCLERVETPQQYVRLSYERGTVLSLNAGASAQVLLAWLPEAEQRALLESVPLQRFSPNTLVEPSQIIERSSAIREAGIAITEGEVDATAMGIAAPLFGATGEVIAAISIVLIRALVPPAQIDEIAQHIKKVAADLSEQAALLEL